MYFGLLSTILLITPPTHGFTPLTSLKYPKRSSIGATTNVLEGKEIQNDFTPINNMILVRKGEIIDQTEGGIFLTGKVSLHFFSCLIDFNF
jgi:hypothetical protein